MKLPKFAIENYQFTIVIVILLVIFGVISFNTMPRTEDPPVAMPGANIIVIYPGTGPKDLEQLVADPIEEAINELDDIKELNTTILDGVTVVSVIFTFDNDVDEKYDEVVRQVNSIRNKLPADIFSVDFEKFTSTVNILQLALISEEADYSILESKAEKLKKEIEKVYGVKYVEVHAYPEQEIRISLDVEKMSQLHISIDQVAASINFNNANIPGGAIDLGEKNFNIKTSGSYENIEDIKNTAISSFQENLVYLKDIAEVNYSYEDNIYYARINGGRCIFLTVEQKDETNIFNVTKKVKEKVDRYATSLPENIQLSYIFDQSLSVDTRINGFLGNLIQGIILVALVIFMTLGVRASLIVILAIPFSILIGIGFLDVSGYGLQQISIVGLVIALGLLVDNAIVITENTSRFIRLGYTRKDAAIKGSAQIAWPIVSSTVTTLLAFIPIIMMPNETGAFLRSMPLTVVYTLSASLLLALTLIPFLSSRLLKANPGRNNKGELKEADAPKGLRKYMKGFIEGPYRRILDKALRRRGRTSILISGTFIFTLFMFQFVGVSFFPKAQKPYFFINIDTPEGSSLEKTDRVAHFVESILDTLPDVKSYATNIGHGNPRIYYNVFPKNYDKTHAQLFVQLKDYDYTRFYDILDQLRKIFAENMDARISIKEFEEGPLVEAPVAVKVIGDDLDKLREISLDIEKFIYDAPGTVNIVNNFKDQRTDLFLDINKEKANLLGVSVVDIDRTVRTCINGSKITDFRDKEGKEYNVVMRLPMQKQGLVSMKQDIRDFDKIMVQSLRNTFIPLKQVSNIEFKKVPKMITHRKLERIATVTADLLPGYTVDGVMELVRAKMSEYKLPPDYAFYIGGELESREESFGGMGRAVIMALIGIFAVLVLQFRSFSQPLIIFSAIPLGIIGSIWALLITGNSFSFTAFIGLTSLIGIVINNSIILIDYANQQRAEGKPLLEALKEAGEVRFMPIVLTTLTTIGGLLPLTLFGGPFWEPMGWTIIGGLLVSTFLTLIVVPVLYSLFTREKVRVEKA